MSLVVKELVWVLPGAVVATYCLVKDGTFFEGSQAFVKPCYIHVTVVGSAVCLTLVSMVDKLLNKCGSC